MQKTKNPIEEEHEETQEEQGEAVPQDRGGAGPLPAGSDAALAAPASPRGPSVVRQPEEAEEPQPKRSQRTDLWTLDLPRRSRT